MSVDLEGLARFLIAANKAGYASTETTVTDHADGSHRIIYETEGWRLDDNFFRGEPYGGREVISYDGRVEWMMLYYGWVGGARLTHKPRFKILRHPLEKGAPGGAP